MVNLTKPCLLTILLALTPALAKTVGYFDADECIDPSGLEECYDAASSRYTDCVNVNCEGQNIDCINVCACVQTQGQIDCAASHCWDRVYSCAYQQTAGDIAANCLNPNLEDIPFYPPPDDAPASCSCNIGKLLTSLYRTSDEADSCGTKGKEVLEKVSGTDKFDDFPQACICCTMSGMVSAFYEICPDSDPSILGLDDIASITTEDEDWPMCGQYMDAFPCYDELGFTPPGNNKTAEFYKPGEFPQNGTKTASDVGGTITSPISGAEFTWTYKGVERAVTVASADAKPTAKSDKGDNKSNDESKDDGESNNDSNSGSADTADDEEDGAAVVVPGLVSVFVLVLLVVAN